MSLIDNYLPIPVYLITGFLGSGKTTLINDLLKDSNYKDTMVIVNEFGDIGLDHLLMATSDDQQVILLDSGCLCCALNAPLQDTLEDLYYKSVRQEIPFFKQVVVETSGLADPIPLIIAISSDSSMARRFKFGGVITTIDCTQNLNHVYEYQEALNQVAIADQFMLTKKDLVNDDLKINEIIDSLKEINQHANFKFKNELDSKELIWSDLKPNFDSNNYVSNHHHDHLVDKGIRSYSFIQNKNLKWSDYADLVNIFQENGEAVLRVKGIINIDIDNNYLIHGIHHYFHPPERFLFKENEEISNFLIVITNHLFDEEIIKNIKKVGFDLFYKNSNSNSNSN